MLQPQALASLKQEYDAAYEVIAEKTKTLEAFKEDYKSLRSRLLTLPDKIEHEALVPLGSKALGFGKCIHTNEILCMLGDSWFMECSAKTAVEIVDRRIKQCNKHLEEQKQEAERLENWKKSLTKLIVETLEDDTLEIVEEVNDDDYDRITKEHRESVRRYHQNMAKERAEKPAEEIKEENEKFWQRLEELELEEEIMKAEEEYEKRKKTAQPTKVSKPTKPKSGKSVTFSDQDEVRIIPEETKADTRFLDEITHRADTDNQEPIEPDIVPMQNVQGISNDVVERQTDITVTEVAQKPSTSRGGPFDPRDVAAPPKKTSLFKQRRQ